MTKTQASGYNSSKWPNKIRNAYFYVYIKPSPKKAKGTFAVEIVGNNYVVKPEVPFNYLERFIREKLETDHLKINVLNLKVTDAIVDKLMEINTEATFFAIWLDDVDLSAIPNATLKRLLSKFMCAQLNSAVLPVDFDPDTVLSRPIFTISAMRPIKDHFTFGVNAIIDFLHSKKTYKGSYVPAGLTITEDYIEESWYTVWENLRDDFLTNSQQRRGHICRLTIYRYSKTSKKHHKPTLIRNRLGETLALNCIPSKWNNKMKAFMQIVEISRNFPSLMNLFA